MHVAREIAAPRLMATVLSRDPVHRIDAHGFAEIFCERFVEADLAATVLLPTIEMQDGFIVTVRGTLVAVVFQGFAIPTDEFRSLHGNRSDEMGPLLDHRSHVLVGAMDNPEGDRVLTVSMAVLQVASVISESPGATAVLWSPAETLTAAPWFRSLVRGGTMTPQLVPLPILARIAVYQDADQGATPSFGVFGVGFYRFFGRDIEIAPAPRPIDELVESFNRVGSWLIKEGLVISDGDTCGASETEVLRVRYRDRGHVIDSPVLMFEIESYDPSLCLSLN